MKNILKIIVTPILALTIILAGGSATGQKASESKLKKVSRYSYTYVNNTIKHIQDTSVAVVVSRKGQIGRSHGTGVVIEGKKGKYVWTNYHVVRDGAFIFIQNQDGPYKPPVRGYVKLLGFWKERDIALLKIIEGEENFQGAKFYKGPVPIGADVRSAGNIKPPHYGYETISKGTITRFFDKIKITAELDLKDKKLVVKNQREVRIAGPYIETDAVIYYGASGGPLFLDKSGLIVGLNMGIWGKKIYQKGQKSLSGKPVPNHVVPVVGLVIPYATIEEWAKKNKFEDAL